MKSIIAVLLSFSQLAMADDLKFRMGCFASVCAKPNGSTCRTIEGQHLQPVTVNLRNHSTWLTGHAPCSVKVADVTIATDVEFLVDAKTKVVQILTSLESNMGGTVETSRPGEIYLKDISRLNYATYAGKTIDHGEYWIVPGLVIDSEAGTF